MRVPMILPHELLNFLSEPGICRTFCFHESLGCPVESQKNKYYLWLKLWFTPLLRILPTIKEQYLLTTLGFNQCIVCIIFKILYYICLFKYMMYINIYIVKIVSWIHMIVAGHPQSYTQNMFWFCWVSPSRPTLRQTTRSTLSNLRGIAFGVTTETTSASTRPSTIMTRTPVPDGTIQ